jgi:hypothetical protein
MASVRELVRFPGTIRGGAHEATCTISATKVSLPGTSESAYIDYSMKNVSKPLPDGLYEVIPAQGEKFRVRLQNGHWLSAP